MVGDKGITTNWNDQINDIDSSGKQIELEELHPENVSTLRVFVDSAVAIYQLAGSPPKGIVQEVHRQNFYERMIDQAHVIAVKNRGLDIHNQGDKDLYDIAQFLKNPIQVLNKLQDMEDSGETDLTFQRRVLEQISFALASAEEENFRTKNDLSKELKVIERLIDQVILGQKVTIDFYSIHDIKTNMVKKITKPVISNGWPPKLPESNDGEIIQLHTMRANELYTGGYGFREPGIGEEGSTAVKKSTTAVEKAYRTAILEGKEVRPENSQDIFRTRLVVIDPDYVTVSDRNNPKLTAVNYMLQHAIKEQFGDSVKIIVKNDVNPNDPTHDPYYSRQRIYVQFLNKPMILDDTGKPADYAYIEIMINSFAGLSDSTIGPASHFVYVDKRSRVLRDEVSGIYNEQNAEKKQQELRRNVQSYRGKVPKEASLYPSEGKTILMDVENYDGTIDTALVDISDPKNPITIARIKKPSSPEQIILYDRNKNFMLKDLNY
ncbi:MAG TPA: hypothetical protein VLF89_03705 [Candidatus Saccharimonadales bacterium]|nr:hypothetical protein [Candidatus Saccharimonadales bacterium]